MISTSSLSAVRSQRRSAAHRVAALAIGLYLATPPINVWAAEPGSPRITPAGSRTLLEVRVIEVDAAGRESIGPAQRVEIPQATGNAATSISARGKSYQVEVWSPTTASNISIDANRTVGRPVPRPRSSPIRKSTQPECGLKPGSAVSPTLSVEPSGPRPPTPSGRELKEFARSLG